MRTYNFKCQLNKVPMVWLLGMVMLPVFVALNLTNISGYIWINTGMLKLAQARLLPSVKNHSQITQQAEWYLLQALVFLPDNVAIWRGIGFVAVARGDVNSAIKIWQDTDIPLDQILASWGWRAFYEKEYDDALAWNTRAVSFNPNLGRAWYQIGIIKQARGQTIEAKIAFEHALAQNFVEVVSPLGWLLYEQGDFEAATAIWQNALSTFHNESMRLNWWLALAASLRADEKRDAEIQTLQNALSEFPNSPQLYVKLGSTLYHYTKDAMVASSYFYQAIEIDKNFADTYGAFGDMMAAEQNYKDAYVWYTKGIELDPDRRWWYVARSNMIREGGNLPTALKSYQETIQRFPDYAQAYYEMAWAYRLNGQPDLAVNTIKQSLLLSNVPIKEYYLRAGDIYEWAGDIDNTINLYQEMTRLFPDNEQAKDALERLNANK